MRQRSVVIGLLLAGLALPGCSKPPVPPEVNLAAAQEDRLWRAGASELHPEAFLRYRNAHRAVRDRFLRERNRFAPLVDYELIAIEYRGVVRQGTVIMRDIRETAERKSRAVDEQRRQLEARLATIERAASLMNEGHLARRNLTKAQVMLAEALRLRARGKYDEASSRLFDAGICARSAEAAIRPIIDRYADRSQVATWKRWVDETVHESKVRGTTAIVVSKVDRNLVVYRNGVPVRRYDVGLGRNGFTHKLYSGDNATPEGRYHIVKKVPRSKYYKALLINYPNDDDLLRFRQAKKQGQVPPRAGIGGLVEIHGGGDEGVTYGCIALDDRHMDEVYDIVDVGTPVTIVGTTTDENPLSSVVDDL